MLGLETRAPDAQLSQYFSITILHPKVGLWENKKLDVQTITSNR